MAKLVILSEGMTGRSHELTAEKTTVGRVEDNAFQIAEASVSSHHCEILLRGGDVVIHDLDSTNGTFINGEKITESVLKPGQSLRLGQIELRLDTGAAAAPGAPAMPPATVVPLKKPMDATVAIPRGVSLNDLESGTRGAGFDTSSKGFAKKNNKINTIFLIAGVIAGLVIVGLLIWAFASTGSGGSK